MNSRLASSTLNTAKASCPRRPVPHIPCAPTSRLAPIEPRARTRSHLGRQVTPYHDQWEKDGMVSREVWLKAGSMGLLGVNCPDKYGGLGLDVLFAAVTWEEQMCVRGEGGGGRANSEVGGVVGDAHSYVTHTPCYSVENACVCQTHRATRATRLIPPSHPTVASHHRIPPSHPTVTPLVSAPHMPCNLPCNLPCDSSLQPRPATRKGTRKGRRRGPALVSTATSLCRTSSTSVRSVKPCQRLRARR